MHLHFSPFQFATAVQVSDYDVSAKKVVATLKKLTRKDTAESHRLGMGSVMSCSEADMIPGSPNAFISPNPVGVMADIKKPMAPTGISRGMAPKSAPAYDHSYRTRGREHYGDRAVVATHGDMIV
jgi:hypothetical protein